MKYTDINESDSTESRGTSSDAPCRPRPRRARYRAWRGVNRWGPDAEGPCAVCGEAAPVYRIEAPDRTCLGCERCLNIFRYGVVQL